jgi:hypothetical protein
MYTVVIRVYRETSGFKTYAEAYQDEAKGGVPLASAHTWTEAPPEAFEFAHPDMMAAIRTVCDELARNSPYWLF